jgi:hypothetical protein
MRLFLQYSLGLILPEKIIPEFELIRTNAFLIMHEICDWAEIDEKFSV